MTNIAITSQCNRSCRSCFTGAAFAQTNDALVMDRSTFVRALDFIDRSQINEIRLLGGEPTLHPDFLAFMKLALRREKRIRVFTNGVFSDAVVRFIEMLPKERITLAVNLNASNNRPASDQDALIEILERLSDRVMAAINVSRPLIGYFKPTDDPIDSLLKLIESTQLQRTIRVGVAHPCVGFDNDYAHANELEAVGRTVVDLAQRALQRGITLSLDCGIVPCIAPELCDPSFDPASKQIRGLCGPVLDILPVGQIIPCFPLAGLLHKTLDDNIDAATVRARFDESLATYRQLGIFKVCANCRIRREGGCSGGCVATAMKRLRTPDFQYKG